MKSSREPNAYNECFIILKRKFCFPLYFIRSGAHKIDRNFHYLRRNLTRIASHLFLCLKIWLRTFWLWIQNQAQKEFEKWPTASAKPISNMSMVSPRGMQSIDYAKKKEKKVRKYMNTAGSSIARVPPLPNSLSNSSKPFLIPEGNSFLSDLFGWPFSLPLFFFSYTFYAKRLIFKPRRMTLLHIARVRHLRIYFLLYPQL